MQDFGFRFLLWNLDLDNGNLNIGFSFRIPESVLHIFDAGVVLFEFAHQILPGIGIWISDCFCVEQANNPPAVLLHLQGFEQMLVPFTKRRVHNNQVIVFGGVHGQEVVMHNADFISLEQSSQVGVNLHRINVNGMVVIAVFVAIILCLNGSNQVSLTGTGFQHCLDKGKVDSFQHFVCDGFWGWVKGIVKHGCSSYQ